MASSITKDLHRHLMQRNRRRKKKIRDILSEIKHKLMLLKDRYHGRNNYILDKINHVEYKEQNYKVIVIGKKPGGIVHRVIKKIKKKKQ